MSDREPVEVEVYSPRAEDFRPEYDRDQVNRKHQTWENYWGWVGTFYRGNLLANGWSQETTATIAVVTDRAVRRELSLTLNEMGRDIVREWSKANGARIQTTDLKRWGIHLRSAREADHGDGRSVMEAVKKIRAELTRLIPKDAKSQRQPVALGVIHNQGR